MEKVGYTAGAHRDADDFESGRMGEDDSLHCTAYTDPYILVAAAQEEVVGGHVAVAVHKMEQRVADGSKVEEKLAATYKVVEQSSQSADRR